MANKSSDKSSAKASKKTMDVSKPGDSTPDTSSRPVIVSHRPMVQDPMFKNSDPTPEVNANARSGAIARNNNVIQPIEKDKTKEYENIETSEKTETTEKPVSDQETSVDNATESEKADKNEEVAGENDEAAVVDAVVDQAAADKKKQNQKNDEETARQAAIDKLVAEKKYFVPIGQVSKRRNRRVSLIILGLIILVVGLYLVADADLIEIPFTLPLDLIKN